MESSTIKLVDSQRTLAAKVLTDAFSADPIVGHFLPNSHAQKLSAMEQINTAMLRFAQPYDHIYTTSDVLKGVAAWLPPNASSESQIWQFFQSGLFVAPIYLRWDRFADAVSVLMRELGNHQKQMPEPNWYLMMLGVAPQYQGQGVGGELIAPILQRADRENTPCYLETSTEGGVRFYQRHGFEIVHGAIVADGLRYWSMKRNPKN